LQLEKKKKKRHNKHKKHLKHNNDDGFSGAFEAALSQETAEKNSVPACTSLGCKTDTAGKAKKQKKDEPVPYPTNVPLEKDILDS
jgi:hypothetical protein